MRKASARKSRYLAIAALSALTAGSPANAQELKGQNAVDLLGEADIIFSRVATSKRYALIHNEKLIEVLAFHGGRIWICDLWVEEGGPVGYAEWQSESGKEVTVKGRSNAECSRFVPEIVE